MEGKEGFWFFTPYAFPNPAGPVVRKMRLDENKRWIISDIDTGDDYEEFQGSMPFKDSELFMYPHLAWMLEGDSIEGSFVLKAEERYCNEAIPFFAF